MGLQESVGAQLRDTPRCQLLAVRPTSVVLRDAAAAAAFRHDSPCRPASRPVPPPTDDRPTDRRPYLISSAVVMNGRPRDGNTIGRRRRRAGDPGRPAQTPAAVPARLVRRSAPAPPRLASPGRKSDDVERSQIRLSNDACSQEGFSPDPVPPVRNV